MPERSSVAQVSQIGKEVTPGTAVAATRRLGSISLTPAISAEAEMFRPEGLKFNTVQALNKEWATVDGTGQPTYEEVIIPLSGAMDVATVAQVMDGATATGAYEWTFEPDPLAADLPVTFTLERGQAGVAVEKYAHLLFTQFGLELSRAGVSLSCNGFAQRATSTTGGGAALTGAVPVPAALTPILPGQFSFYLTGVSAADLETAGVSKVANKLSRVVSANPSIEDRYTPAWFVDAAVPSFATFVENADGAGGGFALTAEADAVGMALLNNFRNGDTLFLRLEAFGPVLYNAGVKPNLRAMFQWDMAVKIENVEGMSDEDGIYGIPWQFTPVYDPTWGKAMRVVVRNKVASL